MSKLLLLLGLAVVPAISAPLDSVALGTWLQFGWSGGIGAHAGGGYLDYTGYLGTPVYSTRTCGMFATDPDCAFSGAYTITIRDLFFDGDQFALYDNGNLIGTTSVPTNTFNNCGDDPSACVGGPWSEGTFVLDSGSHQIDIVLVGMPSGIPSGRAVVMFNPIEEIAAPEPATFGLIGLGLVGVAMRLRKKRA